MRLSGRLESLDQEFLGEPSKVFVLDHSSEKRFEGNFMKVGEHEVKDETPKTRSQILEEINRERHELPSSNDATTSLQYLKNLHKPGQALPTAEWNKLRDTLNSGFTTAQLSDYVQREQEEASGDSKQRKPKEAEWKAGTSSFVELGSATQERITTRIEGLNRYLAKRVLAEKILRECWQLSLMDEVGQLDVRLPSRNLSVLLLSPESPLKSLAESCNATIEVSQKISLVRITGSETACLNAKSRLAELASETRSLDIDLPTSVVKRNQICTDLLPWIQREYGILCRSNKNAKTATLHYLSSAGSDVQQARRILFLASIPDPDPRHNFVTNLSKSLPANLYPVLSPDCMKLPDRQKEWLRWAKPLSDSNITEGRATRRPPESIYNRNPAAPLARISDTLFKAPEERRKYLHGRFTREVVTAAVGKCLFQKQHKLAKDVVTFSDIETSSAPKTFITDVPNTLSFLKSLNTVRSGDSQNSSTFRIRLMPSPPNKLQLPPIELELKSGPTSRDPGEVSAPILQKASAIIDTTEVDMLLPETSLDIRFHRTLQYDLFEGQEPSFSGEGGNTIQSSLLECAEMFRLHYPLSSPQPPMPVFFNLAIPKNLVKSLSSKPSKSKKSAEDQSAEYITGEYYTYPPLRSFANASIAKYTYKDYELDFTSQNTGPFLPKQTTVLSLSYGRWSDAQKPNPDQDISQEDEAASDRIKEHSPRADFRPFYTRACQLAFELGALQHGGASEVVDQPE